MKASNSTNIQNTQGVSGIFPTNCDFMKDLHFQQQQSAIPNQQNGDEYEIYKTLSSGVYENTDGFDLESQQSSSQRNEDTSPVLANQNGLPLHGIVKSQVQIQDEESLKSKIKSEENDSQQEIQKKKVQIKRKNSLLLKSQQRLNVKAIQQNRYKKSIIDVYPDLPNRQEEADTYSKQSMRNQDENSVKIPQYQESKASSQQIEHSVEEQIYESYPVAKKDLKESLKVQKHKNLSQYQVLQEQIKQYDFMQGLKHNNEYKFSQNITIHIVGYEQQYFLKIQTQIFQIEVIQKTKSYSIKRRFTDCANLQKLIRHHYFGYIIYPFPQKTLQVFTKLKLSIGTEQEKIILIEKRLFELQKYLNFLLSHEEISKSIVLQIFLEQSQQKFNKQMNNLLAVSLQQEKQLQLGTIQQNYNNIKRIVKSSFNFFNSYLNSSQESDQELKLKQIQQQSKSNSSIFTLILEQLEQCSLKLSNFANKIERISIIYKQNSQISNIESNIDSVLKLSSKLSSSRSFYEKYADWIQNHLIYSIKYYQLLLKKINQAIERRGQLISKINSLPVEKVKLAETIQEKVELFDKRFVKDWKHTLKQFDENLQTLYGQFNSEWKSHCKLMTKIWK